MEYDFRKLESSECMFTSGDDRGKVVLTVYVDDLIIMSPNKMKLDQTKEQLRVKFKMEDPGEPKYYLAIKFERKRKKMVLNQEAYLQRVVKSFGM